jgi:hypothetical protein
MPYSWQTIAGAQTDLAARLYDSGQQWWGSDGLELAVYIVEALREWNALTSFWRQDMVVPLVASTWWYDIAAASGSARPMTVTDNDLLQSIEYSLVEPPTAAYPLAWTGTDQFNVANLLGAIQRRRDETLSTTGCTTSRLLVAAPFGGRVYLPDDVIDIRRVAWVPVPAAGYDQSTLRQSDAMSKAFYDRGYTTAAPGPPRSYLQSSQPPLSFDTDRIPPVSGNYEVLANLAGSALSTDAPTAMGIPDDWTWVVKWGALGEALGIESEAKDALRAEYAMWRYRQGLALMTDAAAVLSARINNVPCQMDAVKNGDDFNRGWQTSTPGVPRGIYLTGLNLFAARFIDSGTYTVTLQVVSNAPVSDPLQISREDYTAILDEAQHLAAFKLGGSEFMATVGLHKRFIERATLYNSKLLGLGDYPRSMYEVSQLESERAPVYGGVKPQEVLGGGNQ